MRKFQLLALALVMGVVLCAVPAVASAGTIVIQMDSTKPNGDAWDANHGAPDPYVIVNGKSYSSSYCKNTYRCVIRIKESGSTLNVQAWDADVVFDDAAGKCTLTPGKPCGTGKGATLLYIR